MQNSSDLGHFKLKFPQKATKNIVNIKKFPPFPTSLDLFMAEIFDTPFSISVSSLTPALMSLTSAGMKWRKINDYLI